MKNCGSCEHFAPSEKRLSTMIGKCLWDPFNEPGPFWLGITRREVYAVEGFRCEAWHAKEKALKRLRYRGDASEYQIHWGGNDDPRPLLVAGQVYEVAREEVHRWHTKIYLKAFPEQKFNSVHFEEVQES